MELFRKFLCILLFGGLILLAESTAFAQYRSDVFSSPLQIPLKLAGNFCEIRSNHFHSGLDFKTNGAEGQPVFTACEGWISRIKVSTSGFGRVVYINHPQGYTTVYAHLSSFCDPVAALVDSIQRANQSYEMEFFPDSSRFPVIKHQLIGISGNSGGSQAPHLHFEIRDRYSEEPLNPMGFGLPIADTIAPNISKIAWYVERNGNFIQVGSNAISIYNKTESDTFHVCEDVYYAAFSGIDTDSTSSLGIYSIAFIADKDTIYKVKFDRFNFSESKLVNAYIDYKELKLRKTEMQRCFKTEGNTFSVFKKIKNRGVQILDYIPVDCRLVVTDFYGNSSSYNWVFQADSIADSLLRDFQSVLIPPKYNVTVLNGGEVISDRLKVEIPPGAVYENAQIGAAVTIKKNILSVSIGSPLIALQKPVSVSLKLKPSPKLSYWFSEVNSEGKPNGNAFPLKYFKNHLEGSLRAFGNYRLMIDSMPPKIVSVVKTTDSVKKLNPVFAVKITDDLSGIKKADAFINGIWQPCEWDAKHDALLIPMWIDCSGPVNVDITAVDYSGNSVKVNSCFSY